MRHIASYANGNDFRRVEEREGETGQVSLRGRERDVQK
jgi:hypothetical protein